MSETPLIIERRDRVDHVVLNRPTSRNALDDRLAQELRAYFEALPEREDVRVVVLRGAGGAFCSGLDLKSAQAQRFAAGTPGEKFAVQRGLRRIVLAMRRCPQPIIAGITGAAAGGGFVLALASDIRVAADTARMNAAFIRIGLGGADIGASYLLPRLIGAGPASELLLTGRTINAARALALGLVSDVVAEPELIAACDRFANELLVTAPLALRLTKEVLETNLTAGSLEAAMALEDRNQVILGQTRNFADGIKRFAAREPVTFTADGDVF